MKEYGFRLLMLGVALSALSEGCAPSLHSIQTPAELTIERPDWLGEEEWHRLLDGEVVLDEQQNFEDLRVGRAMVIMPIALERGWAWIRDPRVNPYFVDRFVEHKQLKGEPGAPNSHWRDVFDTGMMDIVIHLRFEVDEETKTVRYLLIPHEENEVEGFSMFIRNEPTSHPDYNVVTIGSYIETGWWYAPAFIERRVLRNSLLAIADQMRRGELRLLETMKKMDPAEWFERGLHLEQERPE